MRSSEEIVKKGTHVRIGHGWETDKKKYFPILSLNFIKLELRYMPFFQPLSDNPFLCSGQSAMLILVCFFENNTVTITFSDPEPLDTE